MGAGEQREQEPAFISQASGSHRLELLPIYRLRTPSPRAATASPAAAIIVWPRLGRAICSARRAAPLPPRARLRAVPNAHPPSPLCISQYGGLPGCKKTQESEPRAPPGSQPQTLGRESQEGHQKSVLVNKMPTPVRPYPPPRPLCSSSRPCFSFQFLQNPGTPSPSQHPCAVITPPG